jgi:hypothetical protein
VFHRVLLTTSEMSNNTAITPHATQQQLDVYWSVASAFNTIGTIALIIVIREYFINKALRTPSLTPFIGQVVADGLWLAAYLPYLWNNAMKGYLTTGEWCQFVCYFVAMSYLLSAVSGSLLAITTFDVVSSSLNRHPPRCTPPWMLFAWSIAICLGIAWAATMQSLGHVGTYKGMFCFIAQQVCECLIVYNTNQLC